MKNATFTNVTELLAEGDFVRVQINQQFLLKTFKTKQAEKAKMTKASKEGKEEQTSVATPPSVPPKFPTFAVGRVNEVLMSLVHLDNAYEEGSKGPSTRIYEYREVTSVKKITEEEYNQIVEEFVV